jgi:hypothetical protein
MSISYFTANDYIKQESKLKLIQTEQSKNFILMFPEIIKIILLYVQVILMIALKFL